MDNSRQAINPLKKVSLKIFIGLSETSIDSEKISQPVDFIFGIGVNGLTHFEYMLAGKHIGDEIVLPVNKNDAHHFFAHLHRLLPDLPVGVDPVYLKIVISDIKDPAQREIIKAMAEMAACGADCDCGCGSH